MTNFWMKLRIWTKVVIFTMIAIYGIFFISVNWPLRIDGRLSFIFFDFDKPRVLLVLAVTALCTLIGWWLFRMVFKTLQQFRDLNERTRVARREKEFAEMKAKMDKLRTKDAPAASASPAAEPPAGETPKG